MLCMPVHSIFVQNLLTFHLLCSLKVEAIGEIEIATKLLRDDCDLIYLANIYVWIRKN
jgi:hypothetical protein